MKDSRSNADVKDNALKLVEETRILVSDLLRFAKADANVRLDLSDYSIVERLSSTRSLIRAYNPEKMSTGVIRGYEENIASLKTQVESLVAKAEKNHIPAVIDQARIAITEIKDAKTKKELKGQLASFDRSLAKDSAGKRRGTLKFENNLVKGVGELKSRANQIKNEELINSQNNSRFSRRSNSQSGGILRNFRSTLTNISISRSSKNQDNIASQIPEVQTAINDQKKETEQEREARLNKQVDSMAADIFGDESNEFQETIKETLKKEVANIAENIPISIDDNFVAELNDFIEPEQAILVNAEEDLVLDDSIELADAKSGLNDLMKKLSSENEITKASIQEESTQKMPAIKEDLELSQEGQSLEEQHPEEQLSEESTQESSASEDQAPIASTRESFASEVQSSKASTREPLGPEVQTSKASTRESATSAEPPLFEKAESTKQEAKKEIKAIDVVMSALRERLPKIADALDKFRTQKENQSFKNIFERTKEYVENFNTKQAVKETIESLSKVVDKLKSLKDAFINIIKREEKNISASDEKENTKPNVEEPKAPITQAENQAVKAEAQPIQVITEVIPDKIDELEQILDKAEAEANKIEKSSTASRPTSGPYNKATRPLPELPQKQQNNMVNNLMRNSAQLRESATANIVSEKSSAEPQPERMSFKK